MMESAKSSSPGAPLTYAMGNPPPTLIVVRSSIASNIGAAQRIPSSQAVGSSCCEPTWKHKPSGRSPSVRARSSNAAASAGAQPNLWPNGVTDDGNAGAMRHSTPDPGACSAIAVIPGSVSNANRRTPRACAWAMLGRLLDGVPEGQRGTVDSRGHARFDLTDRGDVERRALGREQAQDGFGRIRLNRVADPRVGQSGLQRVEVLAHPIEIDGQIRRLGHTSQTNRPAVPPGRAVRRLAARVRR